MKREVEEAKEEHARRKANSTAATETNDGLQGVDTLDSLSRMLDDISKPLGTSRPPRIPPDSSHRPGSKEDAEAPAGQDATYTITYAPSYEQSHALAKAADFEQRLLMVEKGLGISSSSIPEAGSDGLARAILPKLDSLDREISTLAQASTANLDAVSRRVRNLASEQQKLNETKEKAKMLREELGKHAPSATGEESEQDAKVNALYGILPTIESLTPVLPPLLDRLRSLRAIHADAATASETLTRIETEQSEMTVELKQWRAGLEKMESVMAQGDDAVKGNMQVMEGWIKDLEGRIGALN